MNSWTKANRDSRPNHSPARKAVWWACRCTRDHLDNSDEPYRQAHTAAEAWVRKPSEDIRRQAEKEAEAGHYNTPASWTAAAAFWSGGSIAPAGAIVMSANQGMPAESEV